MQGLADGYFVLPYTVADYLARSGRNPIKDDHPEVRAAQKAVEERVARLLAVQGKRSPDSFHRELGKLLWEKCGMARTDAGLKSALAQIPAIREEFSKNVRVVGSGEELNQQLEKAGRVADFLELAELLCTDALHREESCGGHFREEYQTEEGEAKRNDEQFQYVAAWQYSGDLSKPTLNREPLEFEYVHPAQRSYK
jgi:succinate dehydrogenase / fumarate reductase flavoprotein subunit